VKWFQTRLWRVGISTPFIPTPFVGSEATWRWRKTSPKPLLSLDRFLFKKTPAGIHRSFTALAGAFERPRSAAEEIFSEIRAGRERGTLRRLGAPRRKRELVAPRNSRSREANTGPPTAALETFFWATRAFDLATLGKLISFTAADRAKADALFAQMPPKAWAALQVNTPEEMFALAWAFDNQRSVGALQIGAMRAMSPDNTDIEFQVQRTDHGDRVDSREMIFQQEADGWKWAIPAVEAAHTFGDVQHKLLDHVSRRLP